MRHRKKGKKLGRTYGHRKQTLAALSIALIEHKRITTTLAKAKALRPFVEPLITRAKEDTLHNRKQVFRHLQNKEALKELFGDVAERVGDRPGGDTRVIKLGRRSGDGAELAMVELVDYNDVPPAGTESGRSRTRRGSGKGRRRRAKKQEDTTQTAVATEAKEAEEEQAAAEDVDVEAADAEATEEEAADAEAQEEAAEASADAEDEGKSDEEEDKS